MRKEQAPYDMDGLVIYQDIPHPYPEGEAPRHVVAFKTGTPTGITTVTHVTWRASKDKLLKPIVHYESIDLSGASLTKASGYNARYVVTNNIGPGAKILLTRSGDVIPKILSVIEPAPNGPDYPDPNVHGNYGWNENQVEFVVTGNNLQVAVGKLKHFLDTLDVKNAGRKRVEAMVAAGILTIDILLSITPQQLAGIPGIGPTLSNQFYNDIHDRITNVPVSRIMDASGIFPHVGERRFEMILSMYPNFLDLARQYRHDPKILQELIKGVKGFNKLAEEIVENINIFIDWLDANPMITVEQPTYYIKTQPTTPFPTQLQLTPFPMQLQIGQQTISPPMQLQPTTTVFPVQLQVGQTQTTQQLGANTLSGITVVFSGFRDRDMEDKIRRLGGKVTTSVSRNTTFLIMKDVTDVKGKAKQAQEKGVQLISKDQFERQYL
jgi:NAD-dependent DNA ligase